MIAVSKVCRRRPHRVTGEFPRVSSTQFIGPERGNDRPLEPMPNDQLVIGVDVARFGDDMSVIYPRRGMDARSILPLTFRNIPLDRLEDQIVAFCNAHRVSMVFVDGTGVGGSVVDHLRPARRQRLRRAIRGEAGSGLRWNEVGE
jgi:hypothetical protein